MQTIPGLRDSVTHRTAVQLYQRHRDTGRGICAACEDRAPCVARCNAFSVLLAAGDDLEVYDSGAVGLIHQPQSPVPSHTGYSARWPKTPRQTRWLLL
jgi:hypothetical protein